MVLFCLVMSPDQVSSPVGGLGISHLLLYHLRSIEGFIFWSMGSCQLRQFHQSIPLEYEKIPAGGTSICPFWSRAIFHRRGPWKASFQSMGSCQLRPFYQSIPIEYGISLLERHPSVHSSDSVFHVSPPPKIEFFGAHMCTRISASIFASISAFLSAHRDIFREPIN